MRKDFAGGFYFKETSSGNLIGEFINNDSIDVNVEAARLNIRHAMFEGIYDSTWDDGTLHQADLEIKKINKKYSLTWTDRMTGGGINYEGEGIIVDDILTGYYKVKP